MEPVAVVTANFGGFDTPRTQATQDVDIEWRYFTDGGPDAPPPWVTYRWPASTDPRMAAKWFKTEPPVSERYAIWIDASMEITSPTFAREAISATRYGMAVWKHPRRDCVYDEADASVGSEAQGGKYDAAALAAQVASYRAAGYPEHAGLYACGTVVWDFGHKGSARIGVEWYDECRRWSPQDQLSLPVVCWRHNMTPGVFPVALIERRYSTREYLGNRWLRIWPHKQ